MALALLLTRPICCRPAAAATRAWLAARPRRLDTTTRTASRQPTMGILFKQVSPACCCATWLTPSGLSGQRLRRPATPAPHAVTPHPTLSNLVAAPCHAVPVGRQDLHVQPVQDSLHRPRTADQQGGGVGWGWGWGGTWSGSRAGMGPSGVLALRCQSPAGLVVAPAALLCPTCRHSKGVTAAPTCSATCECGVICCVLVAPAPHRALAACPALRHPSIFLLIALPFQTPLLPACPACPGAA